MKLLINKKAVFNSELLTPAAKQWTRDNWEYLTETDTPLINVSSSTKTKKGEGYAIGILYLKPADTITVKTLCAAAKLYGCKKDCLESSGQLGMQAGDNAKIKRTILFALERARFEQCLKIEINRHYQKHGDKLRIRLNGTSDINWLSFIASMPNIGFYDYTKIISYIKKNNLKNYHLTFSGSANNARTIKHTAAAISGGLNTVIAINTAETKGEYKRPKTLDRIALIDMDETDYRFNDIAGAVGTLKRKGSNKKARAIDEKRNNFFFNVNTLNKLAALL